MSRYQCFEIFGQTRPKKDFINFIYMYSFTLVHSVYHIYTQRHSSFFC